MRSIRGPVVWLMVLGACLVPFTLLAAEPAAVAGADRSPGGALAAMITTVTGIAISPLLGTGVYGAYQWFSAKDEAARAALPWFAQMGFWLPALIVVGICAAKDAFGAVVPPGMKKPLDVLETIENKASALIAAGAVIPITMAAFSDMIAKQSTPTAASEMVPTGLAMLPVGAIDWSWFLNLVTVPLGVAVFAVVWMASHAINVLILLSPWGAIDTALKSARTGLLALLTLTATINPWIAAGLSIVVIIVSYFVAGWSFRLTVFGWVFCWDFLTLRRTRFKPSDNDNLVFVGGHLREIPVRTYGRLRRVGEGAYEFEYRPWFWMPRRLYPVQVSRDSLAVGRGLFFSSVTVNDADTLFLLPPRYRGHEEVFAACYQLNGGVRPAGLRKTWTLMRDLFGGSAARAQVV